MEKDRSTQEQFINYLDRLLAGEEVTLGDEVDDEMRSALEFARTMLASRDEPSFAFRTRLRERLLRKLAREEVPSGMSIRKGFGEWARGFFPPGTVWRTVASTAVVVVLLAIVGTVWYTGRQGAVPSMAPTAPETEGGYSVDLPANIIPAEVVLKLDTPLSSQSGQAVIYRVESPGVTAQSVETLGKRLGFSGEAIVTDGGASIAMLEGEGSEARELVVWTASGAFEYGFVDLGKLYPSEPSALPTEKEAVQIAHDFLERADLLPHDYTKLSRFKDETEVIAGGSYSISKGDEGDVVQKPPSYWIVSIPYTIDGIRTTGPGSAIEVRIGDNGEVVKLTWLWREVYSLSTEDVLSEEEAFYELVQERGSIDVPAGCKEVIISDVALAYWIDAPSEEQDYVLPVYVFKGECLDTEGKTLEDFIGWAEALSVRYK